MYILPTGPTSPQPHWLDERTPRATTNEERRLLGPAPRKPNVVSIAIRWRRELVAVAKLLGAAYLVGWFVLGLAVLVLTLVVAVVPPLRRGVGGFVYATIIGHRVRAGLIQAGVLARDGRPPWLTRSSAKGDRVRVDVWLRAGTIIEDIDGALPVIEGACGASAVEVGRKGPRRDRVEILVHRPRWGRLGR
jgi:hypothetical protein